MSEDSFDFCNKPCPHRYPPDDAFPDGRTCNKECTQTGGTDHPDAHRCPSGHTY